MARKIKSRYKIEGTLITQSPIHVGGVGGNADTDLALAVNGKGEFYIPGTSLAGALRSWMEAINSQLTNQLWGYQDQNNDGKGHASFIIVEDAPISSSVIMEIRDGVAIDRFFGTAVNGMKYDRAILPKYTKIPLHLTLERKYQNQPKKGKDSQLSNDEWEEKQERKWQEYQQLFAQLINALKESDVYLGGAKSRGLGKVKLYDKINSDEKLPNVTRNDLLSITKTKYDLLTSDGILSLLKNEQEDDCHNWSGLYTSGQNLQNKLNITIKWNPISSVMVKSEGDGITVDMLPLVSQVDNSLSFVIPGSSLKGVWRSQAERIIRTVFNEEITEEKDTKQDLVKALFGGMAKFNEETGKQLGGLSSLYFEDCYAQLAMTDNQWEKVVNATEDKNLRSALKDIDLKSTEQVYHVAIDRWTGGASEGALYTVLEPKGFDWQPIEINFNLDRLSKQLKHNLSIEKDDEIEEEIKQHIALFLLVLRDFMASKIPIGFGTNRGMGAIKITDIKFSYKGNEDYLKNLFVNGESVNFLEQFHEPSLKIIDTAWRKLH